MNERFHARCALLGHDPHGTRHEPPGENPTHVVTLCTVCGKEFSRRELSSMEKVMIPMYFKALSRVFKENPITAMIEKRVESKPIRVPVIYKEDKP